jgi:hypothetical protein
MNQTEQAAYTLTRQRIVNQIDNIVAQGGSDSTLKRLKRFGNAFSWYPEFYPQILEGIDGMSDQQLMSALRTEDSFMKLMAPVKGLPIHHRIANRTGGDLALRTPTDVFLDVRKMIYDKYGGFPGNSAWNLGAHGAIDERMHQGRYGAKGTVFEQSRGLGMAPTEELPIAHGKGTKDIGLKLGQDPALIRSQADEIFKALDPFIAPQVAKFTEIVEHPTTVGQRKIITENIDPAAFDVGRTTEQSTAVRKAAEATGFDVKFASGFKFRGGGVNLGMSVISEYGEAIEEFTGGAISNTINKLLVNPLRKTVGQKPVGPYKKPDPQADVKAVERAKTAVQRGGQFSFGLGGVKFTAPEIGLSEVLGFN